MKPKLSGKRWEKDFEKPLYDDWKARRLYSFSAKSRKPVFSIDTPPPYVNTPVHVGQATTYVLMDMFARFRRMAGSEVLFPLGLDRNGLPIEMAAEKRFGVRLTDIPRAKALEYCEKVLREASLTSTDTFLKLGISFNSWELGNEIGGLYYTDSPEYRALTQETFIDLWKKGLVYSAERTTNYCPGCQTTIADAEVEYMDRSGHFHDIVFKVKETGEKLVIGTTRPELVCTLGMVIYHPDDKKYKHLKGKTAVSPIFGKDVPIKPHPMADPEKGTGIMMMCSFGDLTDIRFFREMKLKPTIAINPDGTMNKNAGFLKGFPIEEARKRMVEELDKQGLLVKVEKVTHKTPVCERSKDPIEFIAMPELYVKQLPSIKKMKEFAKKINFFDPKSRQIFLDWISSVSIDWPISRRRFYATEIPLWYCKKCDEPILPPKGRYYRPWKEGPPKEALKSGACPKCAGKEFEGETRVFDTWFDSSISPLYILKYSREPKGFFEKHSPCSLRPQGKEIIRTWLYYTVLKDYLLTGRCIFRDAWINYHILDDKGKKMSKSKGNVIDPQNIIETFGSEPFRLWTASEGNLARIDFRCSSERIDGAGKFLTKLWNVARFISMFPEAKKKPNKLCELDRWIISETDSLIRYSRKQYEKYDFHGPVKRIKNFVWEAFASHYMELVKNRAYNQKGAFSKAEQDSALYTLHHVLDSLLKLLAPVIPFITFRIYSELRQKDIHFEPFPEAGKPAKIAFKPEKLLALDSKIWKAKKDKGLSLRDPLKSATLPGKFRPLEKDLRETHGIKTLKWGPKTLISA